MVAFSSVTRPAARPDDAPTDRTAWHDARRRDPVGHHVQFALAVLYLFLLPLATAPKDVAFGALLVYALLRLPKTW